jgi:hypothetical protein
MLLMTSFAVVGLHVEDIKAQPSINVVGKVYIDDINFRYLCIF